MGERNRTTKENKKILKNLETEQKKIEPKIDYLQKDKEEIEQLKQTATAKYNIFAAEENNAKAIFSLQDCYDSIKRYMKEGKDAEQILSKEAVEKVIAERLEGKNSILQMPQEGSLPIMFGRKDEKERREKLANKITEFNQRMDSVVHYLKKEYINRIKEEVIEVRKLKDIDKINNNFTESEYIAKSYISEVNAETGEVTINLEAPPGLYSEVLKDTIGISVNTKADLLSLFQELNIAKKEYDQIKSALKMVKQTGYGIASPTLEDMKLDPPY